MGTLHRVCQGRGGSVFVRPLAITLYPRTWTALLVGDVFDPNVQKRHTCEVEDPWMMAAHMASHHGINELTHILQWCRKREQREVSFLHVLDQSSIQAGFGFHQDNEGDVTYVFSLAESGSGVQVAGAPHIFWYDGPGSACRFVASLWHRSVMPRGMKLAVFLK